MTTQRRRVGAMLAWPLVAVALGALVVLARRDRAAQPTVSLSIERRTIRLTDAVDPGIVLPPAPAEMRQAAAELERAAAAADKARDGLAEMKQDLEGTKDTLERQRQEFEGLQADADANAADTRGQLDDAREKLEAKRQELEQASKEAEQRVAKARQDLEGLQGARMDAAAQAGIAHGLGRGRALDMRVLPDPRRGRNPALPPVVPNEAAIAAAAAAGQRGARGQPAANAGGELPPPATVQGDVLRGQADRIRAEGDYAIDTSTAAINAQTAGAMALENRIRTVETFFEARRINLINRAFEAGPGVTLEQAVRLAALQLPPRPAPLELDRATGEISWPRLLNDPTYAALTARIQRHFYHRQAVGGSVDFTTAADCSTAFDELADHLRTNAGRHPAGQHGAAGTFLDGLRREYDMPLDD